MNLKLILGITFVSAVLFTSCEKEKQVTEQPIPAIYNLSQLNASAKFADKIITKDENRTFSIGLKDGTHLNFNLNGVEQTVFGKIRSLVGTVEINKVKEKALILVGENGFSLHYQHDNHFFVIKNKENLDLGYKQPTIDLTSDASKKEMAEYTKTNGSAATEKLIATYNNFKNQPVIDNNANYDVVMEVSNGYSLIDQTLTEQKKQSAEGKSVCGAVHSPSTTALERSSLKGATNNSMSSQQSLKTYTIEIAYRETNFDLASEYSFLIFSFITIDPTLTHLFWIPTVTQTNWGSSFMDLVKFIPYIVKTSSANDQLSNLSTYSTKHPIPNATCRVSLYKNDWDNSIVGISFLNTFKNNSYSIVIVSDSHPSTLAHECGHNMGANHVTNTADVMYPYADYNGAFHYDAANLKVMRAKFGF